MHYEWADFIMKNKQQDAVVGLIMVGVLIGGINWSVKQAGAAAGRREAIESERRTEQQFQKAMQGDSQAQVIGHVYMDGNGLTIVPGDNTNAPTWIPDPAGNRTFQANP
jgi:hypothetical protein